MVIFDNLKNGLYTASNSFNLLWKNKKLILYLGIPIFAKSILDIIIYNLHAAPSSFKTPFLHQASITFLIKLAESYNWIGYVALAMINVIFLLILTIASVALTDHTYKIIKKVKKGFRETLTESMHKFKIAILWAIITFIPISINFLATNMLPDAVIVRLLIVTLFVTWSAITVFVIQAITIKNLSIIPSIKKSFFTMKHMIIEFLGAILWIGLVGLIILLPTLILESIKIYYVQTALIFSYILMTILSCLIPTVYTITKTLLFLNCEKKS